MPLPTSYSEGALLAFMEVEIGPLLADLGLDTSDALLEATYEVQGILGHAVTDETDVTKLRAIARWQAWLAAYNAATNQYDLKAGSADLKRSQMFDQIEKRLARAEASASVYSEVQTALSGSSMAYASSISTGGDPYRWPSYPEF